MREHIEADEEFYITTNTVFRIGKHALELFESSEPNEKRQFLNFLLQNCRLSGKNLYFDLRSPFDKVITTANQPIGLAWQDDLRTLVWHVLFPYPSVSLNQTSQLLDLV